MVALVSVVLFKMNRTIFLLPEALMELSPVFPDEIFYHILSFIDDKYIVQKRLVCNKWRINLSLTCYECVPRFHILKFTDDKQLGYLCNILKFVSGKNLRKIKINYENH